MIVTWDNIKLLNEQIQKEKLAYKVHLSDACSGQCMWLEDLKHDDFVKNEKVEEVISNYFKAEECKITFSTDKKSFWTKN